MHSFSQAGSWTGGGEIKITLSADTPTEARNLAISFRFSEYSCTGTCCWGFLSATAKLWMSCIKAVICKDAFSNPGQDNSKMKCTFQCTVIGSKEHSNSSYIGVCCVLAVDKARQDNFSPSGVISRQSSVHYIAFSEDKSHIQILTISKETHERTSTMPCFNKVKSFFNFIF